MAAVVDLSKLPAPDVIEQLDFEDILSALLARLLSCVPDTIRAEVEAALALESEPLTILNQTWSWGELMIRARINDAARSNLIAYAADADLDHQAAFYNLERMQEESDDRFRLRLQLRIAALAGNGTAEHYRLAALTASLLVVDAAVQSPRPGLITVAVWIAAADVDGKDVDPAAVIAAVESHFAREDICILGVPYEIYRARPRSLDIAATLYREPQAPADLVTQIAARWPSQIAEHAKLGRDAPLSWISRCLHADGAARVDIATPAQSMILAGDEYLVAGTLNLIDGGVDW